MIIHHKLRLLNLLALLLAISVEAEAAATSTSAGGWNPDDTAPTIRAVAAAAGRANETRCLTASCRAIIIIHELVTIAQYEDGDPNYIRMGDLGAALANPTAGDPRIAGRRLDHALLDHPELYGLVCKTGAKLMSRVHTRPGGEFYVPVILLVRGVDMDLHDHGHCARDLVAVLPKDEVELRTEAAEICAGGDENHVRPEKSCDVLLQGLPKTSQ